MELHWILKPFAELSNAELYEMLALRCRVFIVEQNCPYQDPDGKDYDSLHLLGMRTDGTCAVTLRLVRPGISYTEWSIGRVASDTADRRKGFGREAMQRAMDIFKNEMGNPDIRISAQSYLQEFYASFGFERVSEEYMEDDIPHVEMLFASSGEINN